MSTDSHRLKSRVNPTTRVINLGTSFEVIDPTIRVFDPSKEAVNLRKESEIVNSTMEVVDPIISVVNPTMGTTNFDYPSEVDNPIEKDAWLD